VQPRLPGGLREDRRKLARYEVMRERLVRALHELERVQAARQGVPVAPPVAVDVTVSGPEISESLSGTETPTADASLATSDGAADVRAAQTVTETPCPAVGRSCRTKCAAGP
jgi:hypothetical protein